MRRKQGNRGACSVVVRSPTDGKKQTTATKQEQPFRLICETERLFRLTRETEAEPLCARHGQNSRHGTGLYHLTAQVRMNRRDSALQTASAKLQDDYLALATSHLIASRNSTHNGARRRSLASRLGQPLYCSLLPHASRSNASSSGVSRASSRNSPGGSSPWRRRVMI